MVENKPPKPPDKSAKPRADRLADALRDNLKRRKAQARAKTNPSLSSPAVAGEADERSEAGGGKSATRKTQPE